MNHLYRNNWEHTWIIRSRTIKVSPESRKHSHKHDDCLASGRVINSDHQTFSLNYLKPRFLGENLIKPPRNTISIYLAAPATKSSLIINKRSFQTKLPTFDFYSTNNCRRRTFVNVPHLLPVLTSSHVLHTSIQFPLLETIWNCSAATMQMSFGNIRHPSEISMHFLLD